MITYFFNYGYIIIDKIFISKNKKQLEFEPKAKTLESNALPTMQPCNRTTCQMKLFIRL